MTIKHLTGAYPGGYTLKAAYSGLDIEATASVGGTGVSAASFVTILNRGVVTATATNAAGITLASGGIVTNGSSIDTTALVEAAVGVGLFVSGGSANKITNFGTFEGGGDSGLAAFIYKASATAVTNFGTMEGRGQIGSGVEFYESSQNTVINYGVIDAAERYGVAFRKASSNTVANLGTIEGYFGVDIDGGASNDGTISNGSEIDAKALIEGVQGGGVFIRGAAAVNNFGTIDGVGQDTYGVYIGGGSLNNGSAADSTALIKSDGDAFYSHGSCTISNFGTIGGAGGIALKGGGTITNGSAADSAALIKATSRGEGVVAYRSSPTTLINFGTISATDGVAVNFYYGKNVLQVEAGCVFLGSVQGGAGTLDLASGVGTISGLTGGDVTVSGSMPTTTFTYFWTLEIASGAAFALTSAGMIAGGGTNHLNVDGALTVTSTGALVVAGTIGGAGTLAIAGGDQTIDAGASLDVARWSLRGGESDINTTLIYAGAFTEGSAILALGARDVLDLTGAATFDAGATVKGAGRLTLTNATVAGLSVGERAIVIDAGLVDQTDTILLRRNAKAARVIVHEGATWSLDGDVGMARRVSENPEITVAGTFVKSAGSGVSAVGVYVEVDGLAEAATGTLDFMAGVTGVGVLQAAAHATVECDRAVDAGLSARFAGAAATLAMKDPSAFAAAIEGFANGDTIDLLAIAATSATLGAGDTLVIANGATTIATLQLTGDYTGATFSTASDGHGGTSITVSTGPGAGRPPATPAALHPFVAAAASFGAAGTGTAHVTAPAGAERPHGLLAAPRLQTT